MHTSTISGIELPHRTRTGRNREWCGGYFLWAFGWLQPFLGGFWVVVVESGCVMQVQCVCVVCVWLCEAWAQCCATRSAGAYTHSRCIIDPVAASHHLAHHTACHCITQPATASHSLHLAKWVGKHL